MFISLLSPFFFSVSVAQVKNIPAPPQRNPLRQSVVEKRQKQVPPKPRLKPRAPSGHLECIGDKDYHWAKDQKCYRVATHNKFPMQLQNQVRSCPQNFHLSNDGNCYLYKKSNPMDYRQVFHEFEANEYSCPIGFHFGNYRCYRISHFDVMPAGDGTGSRLKVCPSSAFFLSHDQNCYHLGKKEKFPAAFDGKSWSCPFDFYMDAEAICHKAEPYQKSESAQSILADEGCVRHLEKRVYAQACQNVSSFRCLVRTIGDNKSSQCYRNHFSHRIDKKPDNIRRQEERDETIKTLRQRVEEQRRLRRQRTSQ